MKREETAKILPPKASTARHEALLDLIAGIKKDRETEDSRKKADLELLLRSH